jgi:hypothetical protein
MGHVERDREGGEREREIGSEGDIRRGNRENELEGGLM